MMKNVLLLSLILCLLCGYAAAEQKQIDVHFPSTVGSTPLTQPMTFDDDLFDAPSGEYNHQLAKLSICLAVSSFRDNTGPLNNTDHYLREYLAAAGFTDYQAYSYNRKPGANTISNAFAQLRLSDEKGEYVLLAAPICGQGYGDEWLSNFTIDDGETHNGFSKSAEMVYERLNHYIDQHDLRGQRIKVWLAGFSRAAAVSNLTGHMLLHDPHFDLDNIFVYTFGTPNTTKAPEPLPQIHNICGSFDPVPKIPFADWGFSKHGVTYYLPALENDREYISEQDMAVQVYRALMGTDNDFRSITERNWLISKILQMLYEVIPDSTAYSKGYQDAVIAAYSTPGSVLDKLGAMLNKLNLDGYDTQALEQVQEELTSLLTIGVADTVNALTGNGGSSMWYDLLTSGMSLAHEHFPEVYISWVFSTDDTNLLYGQDSNYNRLVFTGNLNARITDGETVLMDGAVTSLAVSKIRNQTFVSLPAGRAYQITLTAVENTRCQIGYSYTSVNLISSPLQATNIITLYTDEFITMSIPEQGTPDDIQVLLNDHQDIAMFSGTESGTYIKLMQENSEVAYEELRYMINSAVIMIPWLLCGAVLLLYLMVILIKRLIRHHVEDTVICRKPGFVLLVIAAVLAGMSSGNALYMLIRYYMSSESVSLANRTLQRASEFLGWGTAAYMASQMIIYAITSLACVRAIHHQLSRIRLVRISCVLLLLDLITLFLGRVFATINPVEILTQLVPVIGMLGLLLAIDRKDQERAVGKRWLPLSRVIFFTSVIFFIRQGHVFIFGPASFLAVVLKALSGIPVLLLALFMWHQRNDHMHGLTFTAVLAYFIANTVINLSMPLGMAFFTVGHILLIIAYTRNRPVHKIRLIVWIVLAALFEVQLFLMRSKLAIPHIELAALYIVAMVGVLVTAERISTRLKIGTNLFLISNEILAITLLFPGDFLLESVELLLYYVAVVIITVDPGALIAETKPAASDDATEALNA